MKKLLLIAAFGITGFINAAAYFALPTERVYMWKSTCGYTDTNTFKGDWSLTETANWIAGANELDCGIRPNVLMPISSDMT